MIEQVVLGAIQGIAEWLPVSSEGLIILAKIYFFGGQASVAETIQEALLLHLGTFAAAALYFRKDIVKLSGHPKLLKFLALTTLMTGTIGFFLLQWLVNLEDQINLGGRIITFGVGLLLLATAVLQLKTNSKGFKKEKDLTPTDGWLLGLVQGLAVLPGLSRSGLTVSALLLSGFDKTEALRLSFLMSLPVVFLGNLLLNYRHFIFQSEVLGGLLSSFVFGLLTIHLLLKLANKTNFGWFVLVFAFLTIVSIFL